MSHSNEKKTLGKGLSALISEVTTSFINSDNDRYILSIPLNLISFNPNQPRSKINYDELQELTSSVKEYGIIQPILVKKIGDEKYQIIAGERRYHAAKNAGLTEIPAILKNVSEIDSFEIAIIENVQRENLSILEEAEAYKKLINEYGHTHDSISAKVGKSRSYVSNTMRLLKLPDEVKDLIIKNKISAGHARAIVNYDNPIELARNIIDNNLNVRGTEKLVKRLSETKGATNQLKERQVSNREDSREDIEIKQIEESLSAELDAKFKIDLNGSKCKVTIECKSLEILDNIISKLSGNLISL